MAFSKFLSDGFEKKGHGGGARCSGFLFSVSSVFLDFNSKEWLLSVLITEDGLSEVLGEISASVFSLHIFPTSQTSP
jgi:hypothetical protein